MSLCHADLRLVLGDNGRVRLEKPDTKNGYVWNKREKKRSCYLSESKMGNRSQFRNVTSTLLQGDKICCENQLLASYSSVFIFIFCEISQCKDFLVNFAEDGCLKRKKKQFDSSS